jgi:hypothetical protein
MSFGVCNLYAKDISSCSPNMLTNVLPSRFVRTIYRRLDEGSKHSFTDLFLASLLQILDRGIVIGGGEAELLPDLQDEDERYAAGDFAEAMRIISGNRHECHLVTLRAGVLAEEESLEAAKEQEL